jgi:hypothetical protein
MGILSRLFGKKAQATDFNEAMRPELAMEIIEAYGAILEHHPPSPLSVADSSQLPYPKEKIKEALITGINLTDNKNMKETLKIVFVELANWQQGVGDKDQGLDFSEIDLNGDPRKALELYKKQHDDLDKWTPLVEAERAASEKELRNLGLWNNF